MTGSIDVEAMGKDTPFLFKLKLFAQAIILLICIKISERLGLFPNSHLPNPEPVDKVVPPLLEAIKRKDIVAVNALLAEGTNPNSCTYSSHWKDDSLRWTALHESVMADSLELVRLLVEAGADIDYCSLAHGTALALAATGSLPMVQYLVDQGADVNLFPINKYPVLTEPVDDGDVQIVDYLIEHGADVNLSNNRGETVLMYAAQALQLDMVKKLVEAGAKVSICDVRRHNAIWYARKRLDWQPEDAHLREEVIAFLKQYASN